MELSFFTKTKITLTLTIGAVLVGFAAWPMVRPATPYDVIAFLSPDVSFANVFLMAILALFAGFISGLIARPYNRQIGALAAPAGLAVLALKSGSMTDLLKANASITQQQTIYSKLQWDGFLWIFVVLAGIIGAVISNIVAPGKPDEEKLLERHILAPNTENKNTIYLNIAASFVSSLVIAHLVIKFFARDVTVSAMSANTRLVSQPEKLQLAFAVFAGFLAAAFLSKLWLRTSYLWPILASVVLVFVEMFAGGKACTVNSQAQNFPIGFFLRPNSSILPIIYVSFGSLASVAGYWWAIRFAWWRKYNV